MQAGTQSDRAERGLSTPGLDEPGSTIPLYSVLSLMAQTLHKAWRFVAYFYIGRIAYP
mgnify:CR=1 FL=1